MFRQTLIKKKQIKKNDNGMSLANHDERSD
jgi:hypothetical protein